MYCLDITVGFHSGRTSEASLNQPTYVRPKERAALWGITLAEKDPQTLQSRVQHQ